MPGLVISKS